MINFYLALFCFALFIVAGFLIISYVDERKKNRDIYLKLATFGGVSHDDYAGFFNDIQKIYVQNRSIVHIYMYLLAAGVFSLVAANVLSDDRALMYALNIFFVLVAGFYFVLKMRARAQKDAVVQYFPEFIDLLILCIQAGMSLEDAMMRVARQKDLVPADFCAEIERLLSELRFSSRKQEAFEKMAKRFNKPLISLFVEMVIHSQNHGTPLLGSLKNMVEDYRQERLLKIEEKASKIPVILTFPLIVFILPTIFIVILGPSVLKLLDVLSTQGF